ncbi:hypothetical protein D9757_003541 [Collybiopsis confluens]|uniref:Uncharacterized protein n=1 Tax=Collybiopsis confluens TaxID=2823264 RepID=A0A8H5MCB3_9AGAR|nr:hypothetical protein D9757_003541 [Collybiopsis confluens]
MSGPQLPPYSSTRSPPSYSLYNLDGEETLAHTPRFHSLSHPTGTFTKHVGEITILLSEQDRDADIPSYGRQGILGGSIDFDASLKVEDVMEVILKVEGRIKLTISGSNAVTKTVRTVDDQYKLWSSHLSAGSVAVCPRSIEFSAILPPNFKDEDGREFSLPPSYEVNFTGISGLYVKCVYSLRAIVKTHGPLWDHKRIVSTPFIYRPRKRPPQPIIPTGFLSTVKILPEEWYQTVSVLKARPRTKLEPIDASLFIPAVRSFGLRDHIPYHVQLSGPITSLKEFYSHAEYASNAPPSTHNRSNNLMVTMSISIRRQVRVEVKGQCMWKSIAIANGVFTALPPSFDSDPSLQDPTQHLSIDWEGHVQCRDNVRVGHFDSGTISTLDFMVLSIITKPNQGAFESLQMIVPIHLVTDTWVEH